MRALWPIVVALTVAACTATHKIDRSASAVAELDPAATAYIPTPENGRYGEIVYHQSGYLTAVAVSRAFTRHLKRATRGGPAADRSIALKSASAGGYTYLIEPEILHWEDRATEWSGLPDKIEVKISIVDVESGKLLDTVTIDAESKWATLGGDRPEHLLNEPISEYADSLFP